MALDFGAGCVGGTHFSQNIFDLSELFDFDFQIHTVTKFEIHIQIVLEFLKIQSL